MRHNYSKIMFILLIMNFLLLILFTSYTNPGYYNEKKDNYGDLKTSAVKTGTKPWLNNSGFDSPDYWFTQIKGDSRDVNTTINNNMANFKIMGDNGTFSNISGTPKLEDDWIKMKNGIFIFPDNSGINQYGCVASHEYDEGVDQSRNRPSVHWRRNITLPVDMSDNFITSASVSAIVNGTVDTNLETPNDDLQYNGPNTRGSAAFYEYIRFYVQISDLEYNNKYEIAYNQTVNLGEGDQTYHGSGVLDNMEDTFMNPIDQEILPFYLNKVFKSDPYNFTAVLGIDIYCEDNYNRSDLDTFYSLLIKSCNLSFAYEQIMNQFTSVSWNQIGQKVSNLSVHPVVITDANLNFKYKIDKNWTTYTSSLNSEIRIFLNGLQYPETIRLSKANSSLQIAKIGGFDVTDLITDDVNLTIQVYLADEFRLDQIVNISIDDVYLNITYSIFEPDLPGGGNGGKTKYIRTPDYSAIVIGLVAGIIALVGLFSAYQKHYKYPPMVRKIRKLRKKIRKDKMIKSLIVNNREGIVRSSIQKQMNIFEVDIITSKKVSEIGKISKEKK